LPKTPNWTPKFGNYDISFSETRRLFSNPFGLVRCQKRHTEQGNSSKVRISTALIECYNFAQQSLTSSTYILPKSYDFRQKSPIHSARNIYIFCTRACVRWAFQSKILGVFRRTRSSVCRKTGCDAQSRVHVYMRAYTQNKIWLARTRRRIKGVNRG
jgi:hypothetical protein